MRGGELLSKIGSRLAALAFLAVLAAGPSQSAFAQAAEPAASEELATSEQARSIPGTQAFEEAQQEQGGRRLADWYGLGGFIMHFLVACSVLAVALTLERAWNLRRGQVIPRAFTRQLREHVFSHDVKKIQELCAPARSSISRVLRAGLIHFDEGLGQVGDAIETAGAHEQTLLRRNLGVLGAIANIATMLGLLGTVLGMIVSFDLIAKTGTGDARVVAAGIFQALVTTAAGLMVGIPSIALYSYFRRKAEVLVIELEEVSFGILQALADDSTVVVPEQAES